jgi:E-phenylitaconyl-CoA hydratase
VSEVVDEGTRVVERALELAARICANGPLSVKSITRLAARTPDLPQSASVALEDLLWGMLRDTEDRSEGRNAFAERREPHYRGR